MKKILTIVVILGLAGVANAAFTDDFDTGWTAADTIVGNNNWLALSTETTGIPQPITSAKIGAAGSGIGTTKGGIGAQQGYPTGAARDITADKSGDVYTVTAMFTGVTVDQPEWNRLLVGSAVTLLDPDSETRSLYAIQHGRDYVSLNMWHGGEARFFIWMQTDVWPFTEVNHLEDGWVGFKIEIGTNYAHGFIADVDDTDGSLIGSWVDLGRFPNVADALGGHYDGDAYHTGPSTIPFDIDTAGFIGGKSSAGFDSVDNFVSTPEPATLGVLALGGVLALLHRRRA